MSKHVSIMVFVFMGSLACPSDPPSESSNTLPPGPVTPQNGQEGQPCALGSICNAGLVCTAGVCLPAQVVSDAGTTIINDGDAGPVLENHEDAGNSLPPDAGIPIVDAGSQIVDAGTEVIDAGPPPEPVIPWLISVSNDTDELIKIDTATGNWVVLCELSATDRYDSTTFGFDGTLYGSNTTDQSLDIIDPCTCDVTRIGYHEQGNIPGITANGEKIEKLFGLSTTNDTLVTLDIATGDGTEVGSLGSDFSNCGTTWSSEINGLYAINSVDGNLHNISTQTGTATPIVGLDILLGGMGIEWHPADQKLYLCTKPFFTTYLYEVNTETGDTTQINSFSDSCTNLAAPWVPVACVDDVVVE